MQIIYADNNATTPIAPEVVEAMTPFLTADYFNPSSMYEPALHVAQALQRARREIAEFFGLTDPRSIEFTSCASESNNAAIFGGREGQSEPPARHHHRRRASGCLRRLQGELEREGCEVTFLGVDRDGNLDTGEFIRALRPDTLLVTIMHGNNETGVIFPIEQLARLTKETDPAILFHTDATQSVGKIPINLRQEFQNVDMLSFSGHKVHAPKGVGALYLKPGVRCRPFLIGGHQEEGRRAGTENVPYIIGLAKSLQLAAENFQDEETRIRGLRDRLEAAISERISYIEINGRGAPRLPQHAERLVPRRRGRIAADPIERFWHLRVERLGLHVRLAGAVARLSGHARAGRRRARVRSVQLEPLQHRRGHRSNHRDVPANGCQRASHFALLEPGNGRAAIRLNRTSRSAINPLAEP